MKVTNLAQVPPLANWRMNFTANAPYAGTVSGDYSLGLSDRGEMFYVQASTDATGAATSSYGTGVRNSNGSLAYTQAGAADGVFLDTAAGTVTVKIALSKVNALIHGAPLVSGSVLCGLRGQAFTSGSGVVREDSTRGGTEYRIP